MNASRLAISTLCIGLTLVVAHVFARPQGAQTQVLASYATDLAGRTPNQRFNARRAASLIDGKTIAPGREFSFNLAVGGWSADRGFRRAPVSYNGVLVDDYGGGVCETLTTLYNAALLSGLPILERTAHTFSPSYAPPGRDAAVAFPGIDLRFRNPYRVPLTVHARSSGHMLVCSIEGVGLPSPNVTIASRVTDIVPPTGVARHMPGRPLTRWRLHGRDGLRVEIYRETSGATELVSDNSYEPLSATRPEARN